MESYFLVNVASIEAARDALRRELPGQEDPWILWAADSDPLAYFEIHDELDGAKILHVMANISGRHHFRDAEVLVVLCRLQRSAGGAITGDS